MVPHQLKMVVDFKRRVAGPELDRSSYAKGPTGVAPMGPFEGGDGQTTVPARPPATVDSSCAAALGAAVFLRRRRSAKTTSFERAYASTK